MRKAIKRFFKIFFSLLLTGVIIYCWTYFPIITGYTAQAMCSGIFVSGRPVADIERDELSSFPCFHLPKYTINYKDSSVTVTLFGMASKTSIYRKGLGATLINDISAGELRKQQIHLTEQINRNQDSLPWPQGNMMSDSMVKGIDTQQLRKAVSWAFYKPDGDTVTPTRSLLIVYNNQLITEQYAKGFNPNTKQMGWSMAKSITNAMLGILTKQGKLNMSSPAPIEEWQQDDRKKITLTNLAQLNSGLHWTSFSGYASTQMNMFFKNDDMSGYTLSKSLRHEPGTVFNYSDGSVNILHLIMRKTLGDENYYRFPYEQLFYKTGMLNTIMEPDASGTFVGSSYIYATARDWARLGLLYLHDGVWNGERILPEGWVKFATTQSAAINVHKGGRYGAGWWVNQSDRNNGHSRLYRKVPEDCFYAQGYDGQYVWVIPSKKLVIVRLAREGFRALNPDDFLSEVIKALPK